MATLRANGSLVLYGPASSVGATPLADDTDATYIESPSFTGAFVVGLEHLADETTTTAVPTIHFRVSVTAPEPWPGAGAEWWLATDSDGVNSIFGWWDGSTTVTFADFPAVAIPQADGTIQSLSYPVTQDALDNWGTDLATVLQALRDGAYLFVQSIRLLGETPPLAPWRVYEAWVEVGDDEPEPTGKPFRRVWPREHGRIWPPPRHQHGRRTVGGYL